MRRIQMVIAAVLAIAPLAAFAKDVSLQQSAVQFARQEYDRADAEHKADAQQLAQTRKALESLKKQFGQEEKKAALSENKRQQAKAKLDKAEQALDRAWKE